MRRVYRMCLCELCLELTQYLDMSFAPFVGIYVPLSCDFNFTLGMLFVFA